MKRRDDWMERAERCCSLWRLSDLQWLDPTPAARLAFCESPHGPAVLKIAVVEDMIATEVAALRAFGAEVCPTIFEYSPGEDAYLMERFVGIRTLREADLPADEEADVWCSIFQELQGTKADPQGFPTLKHFARVFKPALDLKLPDRSRRLMQFAHDLHEILMTPAEDIRLLHGDIHHWNILQDERGRWRLIDPHGVFGNPLYEIGAYMRNPMSAFYRCPGLPERLDRRIELLSARLGIKPETVAEYGFYGIAFSIAWDIEEGSLEQDPDLLTLGELCLRAAGHRLE